MLIIEDGSAAAMMWSAAARSQHASFSGRRETGPSGTCSRPEASSRPGGRPGCRAAVRSALRQLPTQLSEPGAQALQKQLGKGAKRGRPRAVAARARSEMWDGGSLDAPDGAEELFKVSRMSIFP